MPTAIDPPPQAEQIRPGSDRNFGFVFGAVFAIVAVWPLLDRHEPRWWALTVAAAFVLIAFVKARLLRPLNLLWFRFGMVLSRVVSPIVLGAVFFICVTPIALIMRAMGQGRAGVAPEQGCRVYWIVREPSAPAAER